VIKYSHHTSTSHLVQISEAKKLAIKDPTAPAIGPETPAAALVADAEELVTLSVLDAVPLVPGAAEPAPLIADPSVAGVVAVAGTVSDPVAVAVGS
jgi:hypothetical protein